MSASSRIVPDNESTKNILRQIALAPSNEKPICEMNDTTARDLDVIWRSLADVATRWRGKEPMRIPGKLADRKEFWGAFAVTNAHSILPVFRDYIVGDGKNGKGKLAYEIGCGNGGGVKLLLEAGWEVIAVDNSRSALNALKAEHRAELESGQLTVIESDVETFTPAEQADLVIAADALMYTDPAQFKETWTRIHDLYLKEKGTLISNLFRSDVPANMDPEINVTKEMGAWFFPDRRMIRALLTQTGYEVKTATFRHDRGTDNDATLCIQFRAEKLPQKN